jgi:prolyl-tRNA editing enzyme YbaK/EbsC (Cys-tRNA(Pro) deacylase)
VTDPGREQLHPNVQRVVQAAAGAGLVIEVVRFPASTRTAEDAARAVGCSVAQIVKSLVFMVEGEAVMALLSGADRLDPVRLAAAMHGSDVRRADGDEVRAATGYAIGGVSPLGHARPLPILIDEHLFEHAEVWAAAGLPDAVFRVAPEALERAAGARRAAIAVEREPRADPA